MASSSTRISDSTGDIPYILDLFLRPHSSAYSSISFLCCRPPITSILLYLICWRNAAFESISAEVLVALCEKYLCWRIRVQGNTEPVSQGMTTIPLSDIHVSASNTLLRWYIRGKDAYIPHFLSVIINLDRPFSIPPTRVPSDRETT